MNARSAQLVAAALAFLLIVLIGAVTFILLSRPNQAPRATASPTTVAAVTFTPLPTFVFPTLATSPSFGPTDFPTASPLPFDTPTALVTPEITPEVTPEVTPEITPVPPTEVPTPMVFVSPTPTATILPTSTARQIRVRRLGLDSRDPEAGIERYVLFNVDGPSLISAQLSDATGRSRVCLWQGNLVEQRQCMSMRNGRLEHAVFDAGQTSWTLSLIGIDAETSPTIDLTLDFNATSPLVTFENLRFQGIPIENYNGITAEVDAPQAGQLNITGTFDVGELHAYRVVVTELVPPEGVVSDQTGPPTNQFVVAVDEDVPASWSVTISNPNASAETLPVFLEAKFSWP